MKNNSNLLEMIEIASPCEVSWETMQGDEQVRFCNDCRLNVYNLYEMNRDEAESFVHQHEGRLCVRFYRRTDGTVITRDCPVGLRAVRLRFFRLLASAAALIAFLTCGLLFAKGSQSGPFTGKNGPVESFSQWTKKPMVVMGLMYVPAPPPQPPAPVPTAPTPAQNSLSQP